MSAPYWEAILFARNNMSALSGNIFRYRLGGHGLSREEKTPFPISLQLWNNLNTRSLAPILIKGRIERKNIYCRQGQTLGNQRTQSPGSKFSRREMSAENKIARLPKQVAVRPEVPVCKATWIPRSKTCSAPGSRGGLKYFGSNDKGPGGFDRCGI